MLSMLFVLTADMVMKMSTIRTYSELSQLKTFRERYEYLRLNGKVGEETFGFDRYLNQIFYKSDEWKAIRDFVIVRDNGCDLGVEGYDIHGKILIHHMNPILVEDILKRSDFLLNPDYLITTVLSTHNAIHYGDDSLLITLPIERTRNDTCPWRH
nr:MAG TPA: HNH endonuclease bacteriophage, HNH Endonuclease, DNA.52A [Caudoviricetes sp.]